MEYGQKKNKKKEEIKLRITQLSQVLSRLSKNKHFNHNPFFLLF